MFVYLNHFRLLNRMSKKQLVEELHKPARRNFKRRPVHLQGINDLWQADLVEMGDYSNVNNGFRYLLTVIDAFSKFAWALPVKTKSGIEVSNAMEKILGKQSPANLQTDHGKEFYNSHFQNLMKKYNINHYSTYSVMKASIVERFNRTLKGMMWKQFSLTGSFKWIDMIESLVDKYNNTVHSTIKMKPRDVKASNEKQILRNAYNSQKHETFLKPKYKIGENVRISKHKHIFEKGYTPNYTTEIFKIKKIKRTNPITYILEDYHGEIIKGGFYEPELLKAKFPDIYLIQNILKQKGNKVYVKWLGFDNTHNSWIDKNDLL